MLKNNLTIALRNLFKHKGYSLINILGLGMGLTCFALIFFYVRDELSYDRFHSKADRTYRISIHAFPPNNAPADRFASASRPVGRTVRAEFPEVESVLRMIEWGAIVKRDGQYFFGDRFYYSEPSFFDVFDFPLLEGDPETALSTPGTLVITEDIQKKYFGSESPIGKSIVLNDTLEYTVTGVLKNIPSNSHLKTDFLVSYATFLTYNSENDEEWLNLGTYTYVTLREGASAEAFSEKIRDLMTEKWGETLQQINFKAHLIALPLTDIHLHSQRMDEMEANGDITYVYIFSAVALFVLLIACINFMNLATARSMERAREVGIRKVVGSSRMMLIRQFLGESLLMCLLALVIALVLIVLVKPLFNQLAAKEITLAAMFHPLNLFLLVAVSLVVGLLAGLYPAFILSGFPAMSVLRGVFRTSQQGVMLRKGLVVFQFGISVALIACTIIVFNQLDFMRSQDLGFDKEQVLVISAQGVPNTAVVQQYETAKEEFLRNPSVKQVTASAHVPGRDAWLLIYGAEGLAENDRRRAQIISADADFLETYGIDLVAGRDLSTEFETDLREGALVNETAVKSIGWGSAEDALGKTLSVFQQDRKVVGVFKDYHHNSLKQAVEPMILLTMPLAFNYFSLRIDSNALDATLKDLEQRWQSLFPGYSFDSFFLDEAFDNQYQAEKQLTKIFGTFSFLAILIACLGALGLAAFTAQQRTKEIGVRKAMGATVFSIIVLLSREFTKLVLVAAVIAAPVAYLVMDRWLENFAYRTGIDILVFVLAGASALIITWLAVSYQSVKAAMANPVNALRYE